MKITGKTCSEVEDRINTEMRLRGVFSGCQESTEMVAESKGLRFGDEYRAVIWTVFFHNGQWVGVSQERTDVE